MLQRERDQILVEFPAGQQRCRVGGKIHDQRGGLGHGMAHRAVNRGQHFIIRRIGDEAGRGAGNDEAELMDRVRRVGHQDGVAGAGNSLGQIGQPFLGAQRGHHLGLRVELHAKAAIIITGQRLTQPRNALGHGIAMGARVGHRLDHLGDDMRRRRAIWIAHAKVHNILGRGAGAGLGRVHLGKDIGRQTADAVEFFWHEIFAC